MVSCNGSALFLPLRFHDFDTIVDSEKSPDFFIPNGKTIFHSNPAQAWDSLDYVFVRLDVCTFGGKRGQCWQCL